MKPGFTAEEVWGRAEPRLFQQAVSCSLGWKNGSVPHDLVERNIGVKD
jgi:hypothetical protein